MLDPIIADVEFVDGATRPVFEQLDGRQYVLDDDGERAYGVWIIPQEKMDLPHIVGGRP